MKKLLDISKSVDTYDPKIQDSDTIYKAGSYIIYRGDDKKRNWKDFANYQNPEEKKRVDEVCTKINRTINQDSTYKIEKYFTETESEGTWHVLMISYKRKGADKKSAFVFLKEGSRFGIGNID